MPTAGNSASLLMRPAEVAQVLAISRSRAYELLAKNVIPGTVRLGKSIRVKRADLEAWVAGLGKEEADEYQSSASGGGRP